MDAGSIVKLYELALQPLEALNYLNIISSHMAYLQVSRLISCKRQSRKCVSFFFFNEI